MKLFLAALLLVPFAAQDPEALRKLVSQLEDDSFEVRERAQKDLIRMGEGAVPALKKAVKDTEGSTDRAELRVRAESAIREIELAAKARKIYWDPKTLTLDLKDALFSDVLREIGRQSGLRIDASAVDLGARMDVTAKEAPLYKVLDDLCRGQEERTYDYSEEGVVRFRKERHAAGPAFYGGPFRVRLASLKVERSTDFAARKCVLHVTLDADCEKYLKPLRRYAITLDRVLDDQGSALQKGAEEGNVFAGGQVIVQAWAGGANVNDPILPWTFVYRGLSPEAKSVQLQGTLRMTFPIEVREVTFDGLKGGDSRELGDYQAKIDLQGMQGPGARIRNFMLIFEKSRTSSGDGPIGIEVEQRLDLESLVGVDEDGEEHKGLFHPMNRHRGNVVFVGNRLQMGTEEGVKAVSYQAVFNTLRAKGLKKVRFRFTDPTLVREMPFTFRDIALP